MSYKLFEIQDERPITLVIECDNIFLNQKSIDLTIEIPIEKIEQFDILTINGIKFKREKGE